MEGQEAAAAARSAGCIREMVNDILCNYQYYLPPDLSDGVKTN